jgi:RNA methyltransferase, TrmH family
LLRCALDAGATVESVYVAPEGDQDPAVQAVCRRAESAGVRVFPLVAGVLERVADTVTPQPVLAVLPMLDEPPAGAEPWLARPGALIVVLVDVRDPGNAGTVLRAADASGSTLVVYAGDSVDPYNPKTVRASAGSLFHVPLAVRPEPRTLADELGNAGLSWSTPSAAFLGNESAGLRPELVGALDGTLAIPMAGQAESLNVGVACAVICFEAFRQRRGGGAAPRSISGGGTAHPGS